MNLFDNPIFLTQRRLAHRGGVLAPVLITGVIGLCFVLGMVTYLAHPAISPMWTASTAGKNFYGWTFGIEFLVVVLGGFVQILKVIAEEKKSGLWESNQLTPLRPQDLIVGYWWGAPIREIYMGSILAVAGLVIVLFSGGGLLFWLETQLLLWLCALFFGLVAMTIGLILPKPPNGFLLTLLLLPLSILSSQKIGLVFTFLLPANALYKLFAEFQSSKAETVLPKLQIYGLGFDPLVLTLLLQFLLGAFLWRLVLRRVSQPFATPFTRAEAIGCFAILLTVQSGLNWTGKEAVIDQGVFALTLGMAFFLGTLLLFLTSPLPERLRLQALKTGRGEMMQVWRASAVPLGVGLAFTSLVTIILPLTRNYMNSWVSCGSVMINLLEYFMLFALLLEYCRLKFARRSLGFLMLGLFILCIMPWIAAGIFHNDFLNQFSFLSPGFIALSSFTLHKQINVSGALIVHFFIIAGLFILWQKQWQKLLFKGESRALT